jgi:hypothetical protein
MPSASWRMRLLRPPEFSCENATRASYARAACEMSSVGALGSTPLLPARASSARAGYRLCAFLKAIAHG